MTEKRSHKKAKVIWPDEPSGQVRKRLREIERRHKMALSRGDQICIMRILELDVLWMVEKIERLMEKAEKHETDG